MGGFIGTLIAVLAAVAFYGTGYDFLFWLSVVVAILSFWSWGVMHNYAMDSARARRDRMRENMVEEGRSPEELRRLDGMPIRLSKTDIDAVPDWIAGIDMIVAFAGLVLFIWGIIVRFF